MKECTGRCITCSQSIYDVDSYICLKGCKEYSTPQGCVEYTPGKQWGIHGLINDPTSVLIFDVDGVLIRYEFGEHNHNMCSDKEWDDNAVEYSKKIYDNGIPVPKFQELIKNHDSNRVYACSVASHGEGEAKMDFVLRNYNIPRDNVLLVPASILKMGALCEIVTRHQELVPDSLHKIIMIDDTVKTLTMIQDGTPFSTCHVSTFL